MTPSKQIDQMIAHLSDWRGTTLASVWRDSQSESASPRSSRYTSVRKAILGAAPEIVEDWKWMGSPVWSCAGNIAVGNAHKDKVKLTFSHGASLEDPDKLFNNGFNGKVWRAIDIAEGDDLDLKALTRLVRAAIAFNKSKPKKSAANRKV